MSNSAIWVRKLGLTGYCHQFWIKKDQQEKTWFDPETFFSGQ